MFGELLKRLGSIMSFIAGTGFSNVATS
jgi:hypothetical protein